MMFRRMRRGGSCRRIRGLESRDEGGTGGEESRAGTGSEGGTAGGTAVVKGGRKIT